MPLLDRLGRSLQDLIAIVAGLRKRGVGSRSLHEALDTTAAGGRLVFHVFAALAEFIRELIVEGTHEGLAAARARGQRLGRPPAMTPEQIRHARDLLTARSSHPTGRAPALTHLFHSTTRQPRTSGQVAGRRTRRRASCGAGVPDGPGRSRSNLRSLHYRGSDATSGEISPLLPGPVKR
ncbi:recombinase family protein [Nonomuraea jabiensis]|uniref:recombinase family protein n=1 Tax=Nonomuraea jabiensis TaxID=882448 RepID=UPI0028AF3A30|nr:recombinase family protein [Nonomuraea jabiensis]